MSTTDIRLASSSLAPLPSENWQSAVRWAYFVIFGCLGAFVVWAFATRLDSAVIAVGVIEAETNRKTIQHLEGGIIKEILVRDGMRVSEGDVLLRLDPTRVDAQGELYKNQDAILRAQEARLIAEFEGRESFNFPADVLGRAGVPTIAAVIEDQRRLFQSRLDALLRNTGIADAQMQQANREYEQAQSDLITAEKTLGSVSSELAALQPLFEKKLVATTRIAPLEREQLRLQGIVANSKLQLQKLRQKIDEFKLKKQQVAQDYRQEASTSLSEIRKQINETQQQVKLSTDIGNRAEIRAPNSGVVQQMRIFTVGGVLRPGDPILDLVPDTDRLVVRAKVDPQSAERLSEGMAAEITFPNFVNGVFSPIRGKLRAFSRDRITDPATRESYFSVEIDVDRATVPPDILHSLSAGLPAEVILPTGERTVADYLIEPLARGFQRSMRER